MGLVRADIVFASLDRDMPVYVLIVLSTAPQMDTGWGSKRSPRSVRACLNLSDGDGQYNRGDKTKIK